MELFIEKNQYLSELFDEVNCQSFYRELFPSGSFERREKQDNKKGNGIAVIIDKERYKRVTITDEHEQLEELINHNFVILNGLSYFGNERTMRNATLLYLSIIQKIFNLS